MPVEKIESKRINETPVSPERILVLNTLPLTSDRFDAGRSRTFFSFLKYRNDFLRTQFPAGISWDIYKSQVVHPILAELLHIKEGSRAAIDYDVSFSDFRKALLSGQFDVIFLVAHHIYEKDSIEFADREVSLPVILEFLEKKLSGSSMSLHFIVCNSLAFTQLKSKESTYSGTLSFGFWEFPVLESYRFIRHWVLSLDGKRSLSEAYALAIDDYKQSINTDE